MVNDTHTRRRFAVHIFSDFTPKVVYRIWSRSAALCCTYCGTIDFSAPKINTIWALAYSYYDIFYTSMLLRFLLSFLRKHCTNGFSSVTTISGIKYCYITQIYNNVRCTYSRNCVLLTATVSVHCTTQALSKVDSDMLSVTSRCQQFSRQSH